MMNGSNEFFFVSRLNLHFSPYLKQEERRKKVIQFEGEAGKSENFKRCF